MILHGDCRDHMAAMDANSVDAIVTDPPYGLSFMGKGWDKGVPGVAFWEPALRVLKPGGHLLAFGGTRTFHRMAVAIEDAGFEIKDTLSWLYGSGFPKHKSLLKPAWEPIILARKKGASVLNIDACRIATTDDTQRHNNAGTGNIEYWRTGKHESVTGGAEGGRWPANVVLDEDAAALLDAMSGELKPRGNVNGTKTGRAFFGSATPMRDDNNYQYGDSGGASRFFAVFAPDNTVDSHDSTCDNKGDKEDHPCESCANTAAKSSTPSPMTCGADSGVTAHANADALDSGRTARPTHGATSERVTVAGIASGESREAGNSTSNLSTDGCGNRQTGLFQTDTRSITETATKQTTILPTSNVSPSNGTTITTSDSERITASSTALNTDAANDATSTSRSITSPSGGLAPTTDTASPAPSKASESGERPTATTTTNTSATTESRVNNVLTAPIDDPDAEHLRFRYVPKASRAERSAGLDERGNIHPTCKPLSLMRWLVRLVTPPGGIVLDPFAGSGSTGCAAVQEGMQFIGIEAEAEYCEIARRRIEHWKARGVQLEIPA